MKAFVIALALFVLSGLIVNTEAELSLTVISPLGDSTINDLNIPKDFECNAEATFVCEVKPYTDSVVWQINGHSYALCIFQNCFTYPPFPENHIFTMDVANNVFNLTVNPVTKATNNNIYKCDDGVTARSVKATVNVYPNNESLKMDETAEDRITVTTGCIYPNGINDVIFEWFITKSNTTLDPEPFTSQKTQKNDSTVIFDCTEMPTCTVEETSHFNNTVVFEVSDEGEEYFIYVSIMHNSSLNRPPAVLSTERRYKVKNKAKDVKICPIYCRYYMIIILSFVLRFQSIQTLISGYYLYKTFPKKGLVQPTHEYKKKGFLAGIPLVGFVLPIIAACRKMNQAIHHSWSIFIIVTVTTLIDPAVGMCVTSILFLRSFEGTMALSWILIMFLIIGCLIVISTEVVLLIQCEVFGMGEIYYIPFTILYFVILWIYMTVTVVVIKYLEEQQNKIEIFLLCNKCSSYARYKCKMCNELMCKECVQSHKKNITEIKSQHEEDSKFLCKGCNSSTLVINSYCMTCGQFLCVGCMKRHWECRHDLLRHQQHNDEREREFCCDSLLEHRKCISAAHAFCLTCRVYSCTLCLNAKHKTCTLLWLQKQTDKTRERLCCEEIDDHRELPLHGVCLTCESYICTRCLQSPNDHSTHHVASHQQEQSTSSRRLHICCNSVHTDKEPKTINYCLKCQCYFCRNCCSTHRQHRLFCNQSESLEASSKFLCRGCEAYKRLPVECYNLHNDEFLCAKCFENDHKSSSSERKQIYTNIYTLQFKDNLRENTSPCQIHTVLGDASPSPVEVYCLVCNIYMCRVCFLRHRRIAEFWIKSQKGNLFYCKICKTDEHVYPVECCNLETGEYMCANCYECVKPYSTRIYAANQNEDVKKTTSILTERALSCQIHKYPFNKQKKEVPGSVYCLVCNLYLCKHCFVLHRRLKDVWHIQQQGDAQVQVQPIPSTNAISKCNIIPLAKHSQTERTKSYQVSKTDIGLMVCWHFPLIGIGIAIFHWCWYSKRDKRQRNRVSTETKLNKNAIAVQ